jgi:hypothetical protein
MKCGHWIGAESRFCGATEDVVRFKDGYRCPVHTPAEMAKLVKP